ncbi:MAG: oxygen-independent coproporphyrinogen-3 oxidase [Planctomycetota bacterium]|jgi:oxygen-independent coproporphyrinogen-3 oxidase
MTSPTAGVRAARPPEEDLGRAPEGTPLYVHLPFCVTKCHYCDFFSVPDEGQDIDGMVGTILAEAEARAPWRPRTVFLGGGTPSLLSAAQLKRLLDGLDKLTEFRSSAVEITAECNPESLDEDKAHAFLDLGVKRLSIGLQSLSDETLKLFGRVHTAKESFEAFRAARRAGVKDLNVDVIYAAPGQTEDSYTTDIAKILDLQPDHLSAYNLTFEEETRFQRWLKEGKVSKAPDELELALFYITRERLQEAGLGAYEISNYSSSGRECQHNINYWRNGHYVGLGPGAVSHVNGSRGGNPRSIAPYRRWVKAAGHATQWRETLSPQARLGETWWLGLRLSTGIDPAEALATAGLPKSPEALEAVIASLLDTGHLERAQERLRLTPLGLPLADAVASKFLGAAEVGA